MSDIDMVSNSGDNKESLYLVTLVYYNLYYDEGKSKLPRYFLDKDLINSFYSLRKYQKGPDLMGRFKFEYPKFAYEYDSLKDIDHMERDKLEDLIYTKISSDLVLKFKANNPFDNLLFNDLNKAIKFVNILLKVYDSNIEIYSKLFKAYKEYVDYVRFNSIPGSTKYLQILNKVNTLLNPDDIYDEDSPTWVPIDSTRYRALLGRILIRKVNINTVGADEDNLNPYRNIFEEKSPSYEEDIEEHKTCVNRGETPVIEYVRYTPRNFVCINPTYTNII